MILPFFTSKRSSNALRWALSWSPISSSSWLASSLRMVILNHSSRFRSARYDWVILLPFFRPFGPLSASLPTSAFSRRLKIASSTMRSWSSKSFLTWRSCSFSIEMARSSFSMPSRVNTCTSITVPSMPEGTRSEVSFTSEAFSPKMARSNFSSGVSWVSPFGVTLPTRMSPAATSAPMYTMPDWSSLPRLCSPTLGISAVISSEPSLVSRATQVSSSMWIVV